jgi:hypothetical protein
MLPGGAAAGVVAVRVVLQPLVGMLPAVGMAWCSGASQLVIHQPALCRGKLLQRSYLLHLCTSILHAL